MEQINESKFEEVIKNKDLTVVVFSASWCMPCRRIKPIIEKISNKFNEISFFDVDIDENVEITKKYQVFGVPTIICFKNGEKVDSLVGLQSSEDIETFILSCKNN